MVELYPALHEGTLTTHTDENGIYTFTDVPNIPYYVHAWHEVSYNGQDYCLRLGMPNRSDYDVFNASEGVVRNFKWQLTGEIPEEGAEDWYFGGWVVLDVYGDMRGGEVEVTFTPVGPLIDGSSISSFTRTFDPQQVDDLYDIPAGSYTLTATLVEPGGARTALSLNNDDTYYEEPSEQVALDFDSAGNRNYSSGLTYATLFIYSPYE